MTRQEIRRAFSRLSNQSELVDICTGLYDKEKNVPLSVYRERNKSLASIFELLMTTLALSLAETATPPLVADPASLTNEELAILVRKASRSVDDAFDVVHAMTNVLEKRFRDSQESGELNLSYWKEITRQSGEWATGLRMCVIREDMQKTSTLEAQGES